MIRLFPFTSFTPPALRRSHEHRYRSGGRFDVQIGTQGSDELVLDLTAADFVVLLRSSVRGLFRGSRVFFPDVDANFRVEDLEESLDDNALQELHVL